MANKTKATEADSFKPLVEGCTPELTERGGYLLKARLIKNTCDQWAKGWLLLSDDVVVVKTGIEYTSYFDKTPYIVRPLAQHVVTNGISVYDTLFELDKELCIAFHISMGRFKLQEGDPIAEVYFFER